MNKITLCMIVKNEEKYLENCLKTISPYVDEIVIVDSKSTDRTKEIAFKYTDKVYDYDWINDFSHARNFSISKASNDFVLILDADELLLDIDIDRIKEMLNRYPKKIGRISLINEFTRSGNKHKSYIKINRLFNKNYYEYKGKIHEQVASKIDLDNETYDLPLLVNHLGYEGDLEERKQKTKRNIDLLKISLEETPDDPYIIYQLGKSYYMEEDYKQASEYFGQALYYDLDIRLEYVQDMVESYGYSLINSEQYEQALQLVNVYDEFSHSADFIFMIALVLMNNGRFEEAVGEFLKATKIKDVKMEGVNSFLAFYNIGVIYEALGDLKNARKYYKMCGAYDLACKGLKRL